MATQFVNKQATNSGGQFLASSILTLHTEQYLQGIRFQVCALKSLDIPFFFYSRTCINHFLRCFGHRKQYIFYKNHVYVTDKVLNAN